MRKMCAVFVFPPDFPDAMSHPNSSQKPRSSLIMNLSSDASFSSLSGLPPELLTRIFILSRNPNVFFVSRYFHDISKAPLLRAHFLLALYGLDHALSAQAAKHSHIFTKPVVELLIPLGANPEADEDFILLWAYQHSFLELPPLILDAIAARHTLDLPHYLILAACKGILPLLELLITRYHVDPHYKDEKPLQEAAFNNQLHLVHYLIQVHNCDLHVEAERLLRHASQMGYADLIDLLLAHGASVSAYNSAALFNAAHKGHTRIVAALLDHGADVHADSDAAIRYAAAHGHVEVVRLLLDHNARVDAVEHKSLRDAAQHGFVEVARMLLDAGSDPDARSGAALSYAALNGHREMVALLLERGANPRKNDSSALGLAIRKSHIEIARMLVEAGANLAEDVAWSLQRRGKEKIREVIEKALKEREGPTSQSSGMDGRGGGWEWDN